MDIKNQAGKSGLVVVAVLGWALFIVTVLYSVLVYGPAKHKAGLAQGIDPNIFSEAPPDSDTTVSELTASDFSVVGILKEIKGQQLTIEVPTFSQERPREEKTYILSEEASLIKRVVVITNTIEEDGFQLSGGTTEDQPIGIDDLILGDEIQFTSQVNEEGADEIIEIIV